MMGDYDSSHSAHNSHVTPIGGAYTFASHSFQGLALFRNKATVFLVLRSEVKKRELLLPLGQRSCLPCFPVAVPDRCRPNG